MNEQEWVFNYITNHGPVSRKSERMVASFQKNYHPTDFSGESLENKLKIHIDLLFKTNRIVRFHTGRGGLMVYMSVEEYEKV